MLGSADALVTQPMSVLAVLSAVLAALFLFRRSKMGTAFFRVAPLLIFAYFLPTTLSNTGVIPLASPLYGFITDHLLPASLLLLVLCVDVPAILRLGRDALVLFLVGTASVIVGGPLAFLIVAPWLGMDAASLDTAWRGFAALSGSWIGGGANMVAVQQAYQAPAEIMGVIIVIDVAVANAWMFVLLLFAGRQEAMDRSLGADSTRIDDVRRRVETYQAEVARPTNLTDLLAILALAIVGSVVSALAGGWLIDRFPVLVEIGGRFTWTVLLVTLVGLALSFTPARRLEGAGASVLGSVFLYLLVASIGAKADFARVVASWKLLIVGVVWMAFHAGAMLLTRRLLRSPIFFLAVGSKANIGGAASAPVVAAAFHPALAPVGALLGVAGYLIGTYGGLLSGRLFSMVYEWIR